MVNENYLVPINWFGFPSLLPVTFLGSKVFSWLFIKEYAVKCLRLIFLYYVSGDNFLKQSFVAGDLFLGPRFVLGDHFLVQSFVLGIQFLVPTSTWNFQTQINSQYGFGGCRTSTFNILKVFLRWHNPFRWLQCTLNPEDAGEHRVSECLEDRVTFVQ